MLSQLRRNGSHTIIDMVTVHLDIKKDCFFAEFSNLGLSNVPITDDYPEKFDRLLCGGIWCIVQLEYESEGDSSFGIEDFDSEPRQKKQKDISPISIRKLTPSRCLISILRKYAPGVKLSHRTSGWMLCCALAVMSRSS